MAPEVLDTVLPHLYQRPCEASLHRRLACRGSPWSCRSRSTSVPWRSSTRTTRAACPSTHPSRPIGTLITQAWCDFIKANPVRIGVSLDGPAFLHDAFRKTREGLGSRRQVSRRSGGWAERHPVPRHRRPHHRRSTSPTRCTTSRPPRGPGRRRLQRGGDRRASPQLVAPVGRHRGPVEAVPLAVLRSGGCRRLAALRVREFDSTLATISSAEEPGPQRQPPGP